MKTHCQHISRRDFIKTSAAVTAAFWGASTYGLIDKVFAQDVLPDLVAIKNGGPDVMFDTAIEALGGMRTFVKQGQIVVVKPNIGWSRAPETGANTNPLLVKRVVEHCVEAGAQKVYVFDNSVDYGPNCYEKSGLEDAAKAGGAIVVPAHDSKYFQEVTIPDANVLKTTSVHEALLESDVFINVPILKHHFASHLTIAMKNLMGVVRNRMWYHARGLHDCIADFCLYRKPDLNIVDAYRVTMKNGPQRAREQDLDLKKTLLLSTDIVAVDAAAAMIYGVKPEQIRHIALGHEKGIGTMDLQDLNIKRIAL